MPIYYYSAKSRISFNQEYFQLTFLFHFINTAINCIGSKISSHFNSTFCVPSPALSISQQPSELCDDPLRKMMLFCTLGTGGTGEAGSIPSRTGRQACRPAPGPQLQCCGPCNFMRDFLAAKCPHSPMINMSCSCSEKSFSLLVFNLEF